VTANQVTQHDRGASLPIFQCVKLIKMRNKDAPNDYMFFARLPKECDCRKLYRKIHLSFL